MITGVHALIYSDDPDATRAFLRDVLKWPNVDAHGGWLIFRSGPSELGVHPTSDDRQEQWSTSPHHEIAIMCDDAAKTVEELSARGAEFAGPVQDRGFGFTVMMRVPGASEIMLYEPKHPVAFDL
ncbi:MAG TPA: VOC family protein [Acidimicrobiales bacterium]|nr:VOC family protein [Acidimicrobiales bacterium]